MLEKLDIAAPVPLLNGAKPLVLIGLDNAHLTTTLEIQQAIETGISAVRTPLGWMLEGAVNDKVEEFEMGKKATNSKEIMESLENVDTELGLDAYSENKDLGMEWRVKSDEEVHKVRMNLVDDSIIRRAAQISRGRVLVRDIVRVRRFGTMGPKLEKVRPIDNEDEQWATKQILRAVQMNPEMGLLPFSRLAVNIPPFSYTGVDYFGPMMVVIDRRREKRWGVLFVCLTTRAVHIEVAHSLSANSCCMAMDNFVSRRRLPVEIRSGNGTNFVSLSKSYCTRDGRSPRWIFNSPAAPQVGGSWERLVGSVKRTMDWLQKRVSMNDEENRHLLTSVEGILNSRPLTEFPVDSKDDPPLTPNDFLHGFEEGTWEGGQPADVRDLLGDREKYVTLFWRRWIKEYLPTIAARPKWQKKTTPLASGDLVLIVDGDHRGSWQRGVIISVETDILTKQVRTVTVQTSEGTVLRRPTNRVAPLRLKE
jgi:transposase InsO family protein